MEQILLKHMIYMDTQLTVRPIDLWGGGEGTSRGFFVQNKFKLIAKNNDAPAGLK
jgi:hypothetical protein